VHSLRTVVGLVAISLMRVLSLILRLLGNVFLYLGVLFKQAYDIPLFVPLWLEERMNRAAGVDATMARARR